MTAELSFQDGVQVWYPGEYCWVDASIFKISEAAQSSSPANLLRALLRDEHYVNVYYTADDRPAVKNDAIRARANGHQSVDPVALTGYYNANAHIFGREPADTHGPYFLASITSETFKPVSAEAGRLRLVQWLEANVQHPSRGGLDDARLKRVMELMADADTIFCLAELDEAARHPEWPITDPFIELIAVDLTRATVTLIAAGGD